jgi:hypothetical protein
MPKVLKNLRKSMFIIKEKIKETTKKVEYNKIEL